MEKKIKVSLLLTCLLICSGNIFGAAYACYRSVPTSFTLGGVVEDPLPMGSAVVTPVGISLLDSDTMIITNAGQYYIEYTVGAVGGQSGTPVPTGTTVSYSVFINGVSIPVTSLANIVGAPFPGGSVSGFDYRARGVILTLAAGSQLEIRAYPFGALNHTIQLNMSISIFQVA